MVSSAMACEIGIESRPHEMSALEVEKGGLTPSLIRSMSEANPGWVEAVLRPVQ